MGLLGNLFGSSKASLNDYLSNGAAIIDVRTPSEYQGGHVAGSKNIPLQSIESRLREIKAINKPIILCCASGMRSGQATSFLKKQGLDCINGGSWTKVNAATV